MVEKPLSQAARGGNAVARGDGSIAIGGDAGPSGLHPGGRGGDVDVSAPGVVAVGGAGGGGGILPGMPGMDVTESSGGVGSYIVGGMGGEAAQPDGRGGRGGRAAEYGAICLLLGKKPRPYMKRPYWDNESEPGCGGDGADTPRYRARRLIIEMIKAEYLCAPKYFTTEIWYETERVSPDAINRNLFERGHRWRVDLVRGEYTITDL